MALVEGCKHSLEISIPFEEVQSEEGRVLGNVQKRVKMPGFRPGKAPASLIRQQFAGDIRQQVLEALIPKYLRKEFEQQELRVVGTPDISDVHYHAGEPLRFKAEFEVVPEVELGEYKGIEVPYRDPEVTDEDVEKRIGEIREQKAEYVNVDPRPLEDGDFAVVSLASDEINSEEMMLEIGGEDTMQPFTESLRGASPGDDREFDVTYPEDYGEARLAGKTVHFRAHVKGVRRKELPELNDDFAQDLGDYRNVDELRDAVRRSIFAQRQYDAQQEAKNQIVEKLVDAHEFPVPETFVDRQIQNRTEQRLRALQAQGLDISKVNLDWSKVKETQRDKAVREVKASMLLSRVAERETIHATVDEVDSEVTRMAKQQREPFAALKLRLEKDGTLERIANHVQTEKTLNFLFEHARKTTE